MGASRVHLRPIHERDVECGKRRALRGNGGGTRLLTWRVIYDAHDLLDLFHARAGSGGDGAGLLIVSDRWQHAAATATDKARRAGKVR